MADDALFWANFDSRMTDSSHIRHLIPVSSSPALDPIAWEAGCAADRVRNELIIPHLEALLRKTQPRTVAEVGPGTGYVTRALASADWASATHWVLIDRDDELLAFAAASMPVKSSVTTLCHDLTAPLDGLLASTGADCAFLVFTLLEFPMTETVARNCAELLKPGGELLVYIPDVMRDVITEETVRAGALAEYVEGHAALHKTDRFTGRAYAFHANRVEHLLRDLLSAGMTLISFEIAPRPDKVKESIYCLGFRRT